MFSRRKEGLLTMTLKGLERISDMTFNICDRKLKMLKYFG